jgi:hypothetical protein
MSFKESQKHRWKKKRLEKKMRSREFYKMQAHKWGRIQKENEKNSLKH